MASEDREPQAIAASARQTRDRLGQACFALHLVVMIYFVVGWFVPARGALLFYMLFVPAVAVQWQFNKNACVLNNIESWLRSGRWRDPGNAEEGAWLATLCENALGFRPGPLAVDIFTYALLFVLWSMALIHMLYWNF